MQSNVIFFALAALGSAVLAAPGAAHAAATQADLMVAARALGFIQNPPRGDVMAGIVFTPASAASAADAESLAKMMGSGLRAGNLTLKPVLIPVDDVAAANVGLFFLTEGVGESAAKVIAATKAKRIPCITVDLAQVRSGACIMGVQSQPKVQILVNRASAESSGISFAAVFRMMITEF